MIISSELVLVIPKLPNLADSLLYLTYLQEAVNYFQSEHKQYTKLVHNLPTLSRHDLKCMVILLKAL